MKIGRLISVCAMVLGYFVSGNAQITNLTVNGASSNFTMESGGQLTWEMNVPSGSSVTGEIWYDVNNNGTIDPSTDFRYVEFIQTDGDTIGNSGPNDMDGTVNGHILFSTQAGVAPGKYIFRFTQGSSIKTVAGTVTALTAVAHTLAGNVTPPSGHSAQWLLVEARPNGNNGGGTFWDAVTDANGNYTIKMDADTSGNPWIVAWVRAAIMRVHSRRTFHRRHNTR